MATLSQTIYMLVHYPMQASIVNKHIFYHLHAALELCTFLAAFVFEVREKFLMHLVTQWKQLSVTLALTDLGLEIE